jgi:hypothetical protein
MVFSKSNIELSDKYFRITTENYAIYLSVKDYEQIFPIFGSQKKVNTSFLIHSLSEEEYSEMIIELRSKGTLYEHMFEYMEFDKEILKISKKLKYDSPINEDIVNESLKMSSILYETVLSHRNNNWKRLVKINKIKEILKDV